MEPLGLNSIPRQAHVTAVQTPEARARSSRWSAAHNRCRPTRKLRQKRQIITLKLDPFLGGRSEPRTLTQTMMSTDFHISGCQCKLLAANGQHRQPNDSYLHLVTCRFSTFRALRSLQIGYVLPHTGGFGFKLRQIPLEFFELLGPARELASEAERKIFAATIAAATAAAFATTTPASSVAMAPRAAATSAVRSPNLFLGSLQSAINYVSTTCETSCYTWINKLSTGFKKEYLIRRILVK